MNKLPHKLTRWLIGILVIGAVVVLLLSRTGVGESVKRESARLFDYEYIPNQQVDIDRCEVAGMADSVYKDFRKKYRFHYQVVGKNATLGCFIRIVTIHIVKNIDNANSYMLSICE